MVAFTPVLTQPMLHPDGSFSVNPCPYVQNLVLTAGTAKSVSIPTGARRVFINSTTSIWAAFSFTGFDTVTAIVPSADVTNGTGMVLNPVGRTLGGISNISVIGAADSIVSFEFYN